MTVTDADRERARDIMDEACLPSYLVERGVDRALCESIAAALAQEREAGEAALRAETARLTEALRLLDTGTQRALALRAMPHSSPAECMDAMTKRIEEAVSEARAALGRPT